MAREFARHGSHRERLVCGSECRKAWLSVAANVLEERLQFQCKGDLQILLKQWEMKRNIDYDIGVRCCCVFIRMYLTCLKYVVVISLESI